MGEYMPSGQSYKEREKKYALTVINTIAAFSIEQRCINARDFRLDIQKNKIDAIKLRKKVK